MQGGGKLYYLARWEIVLGVKLKWMDHSTMSIKISQMSKHPVYDNSNNQSFLRILKGKDGRHFELQKCGDF